MFSQTGIILEAFRGLLSPSSEEGDSSPLKASRIILVCENITPFLCKICCTGYRPHILYIQGLIYFQ